MFNFCNFIFYLFVTETVGFLSGFFSGNIAVKYSEFMKPQFSAPGFVFQIAWVILYFMMALSISLINENKKAFYLYFIQLLINFLWPIFFFGLDLKLFSFIWLIFLFVMVIITTKEFSKTNIISSVLMFPYVFWLIYAGYLNFGVWLLNR